MLALPETFRTDTQAAAEAVVIDPERWGRTARDRPELLESLQEAIVSRRKVALDYAKRNGPPTQRLVDPWGLAAKDGIWYLIAGTAAGQRTFRVERIVRVTVTDHPAERPADFDLRREWERIVDEVEQHRSLLSAAVLIESRLLPVLHTQFGRHCELLEQHRDGRARLRVAAPTAVSIAEQLAGWGAAVEVLEPESVKIELARIGSELVAGYPTPW